MRYEVDKDFQKKLHATSQAMNDHPTDFEIVRFRVLNPTFDHAEMNDAISALTRIQNEMVAKANELLNIRTQLRKNYE